MTVSAGRHAASRTSWNGAMVMGQARLHPQFTDQDIPAEPGLAAVLHSPMAEELTMPTITPTAWSGPKTRCNFIGTIPKHLTLRLRPPTTQPAINWFSIIPTILYYTSQSPV